MRRFNEGDKVRLDLCNKKEDIKWPKDLLAYDGTVQEIETVRTIRSSDNPKTRNYGYIYTIKGITSPFGISYSFCNLMLEEV